MAKTWVKRGNLKGPKGDVGTWYQRVLTTSDQVDTLTTAGVYDCRSGAVALAIGLPIEAVASVEVLPIGTALVQRVSGVSPNSEVWQRERLANGTAWGAWRRTDFRREQPEGLRAASPAGMKIAPQAVTLGHGGAQVTGSGYARGLIRLASTASRVRVHIANRNPRYGLADDAAVALAAVTIGIHTAGGAQNTVATISTGASTGATGYTSPWVDAAAYAGKDVLIGYDYSSTGTIQSNIGTGYGATGATGAAGTGTAAKLQALPLFVWLEVEVPSSTPIIAGYGDSLIAGVGSSNVIYDSPVSQYARTIDGVPVHFAHSGDTMLTWDAAAKKWSMYGDFPALADAVIFGMGSNDVFGGATLADLQSRFAVAMASIKHRISPNVYGATIMPRTGVTGAAETVRRQYNTWLKANPDLRKVFDFAATISTDDEAITPAYDADGTHLTTAGYTQNAAAITSVVDRGGRIGAVETRVTAVEGVNTAQDSRLTTLETDKYKRPDLVAGSDWNTIMTTGVYKQYAVMTDSLAQGAPIASFRGELRVQSLAAGNAIQWATSWAVAGPTTWVRASSANVWGAWKNLDDLNFAKPFIAGTTDLDTVTASGVYPLIANITDWVGQHYPINGKGTLTVENTGTTGFVQTFKGFSTADPRIFMRYKVSGILGPWKEISPAVPLKVSEAIGAGGIRHEMLVDDMLAYHGGPIGTSGAAPVALTFDDYPRDFRDQMRAALTSRGIPYTLALSSRMYDAAAVGTGGTWEAVYNGATGTTWSEINGWLTADGAEVANHGATHQGNSTQAGLFAEIVTGQRDLQAALPAKPIFGWIQPSATYDVGFNNGDSIDAYANTLAGKYIWDNHAIITGVRLVNGLNRVPRRGQPVQGLTRQWISSPSGIASTKTAIQAATAAKHGIIVGSHANDIPDARITAADFTGFLDWLLAEQTAGRIKLMLLSQWAIADTKS